MEAIPYKEVNDWMLYFEKVNEMQKLEEEKQKGNLLALDPNDIASKFNV